MRRNSTYLLKDIDTSIVAVKMEDILQGRKLYVGNFSYSVTNDELEDSATICRLVLQAPLAREDEMVPRTE